MNNYVESKKRIEAIRNKNGEPMFRMAISHLMDVGIRHLTEESVKETCDEIMKEDDSKAFMTNEFKCDLIKAAYELAQVPQVDLLIYIQREVEYNVFDDSISYGRAIQMTKNCIDWIIYGADPEDARSDLNGIGFDEDELEVLGYGYLIEEEDKE